MSHKTELQRIQDLEDAMQKLATKDDVAEIVREVFKEMLLTAGKGTKAGIITVAAIIVALAAIGGGLKFILGLIGFHYIK